MPVLQSIHIYPIKGTRGTALEEAAVEPRGLQHDRRWMLVDSTGTFLSQREQPRLALVQAQVRPAQLFVEAPGMAPLAVEVPAEATPRLRVRVWRDALDAVPAADPAHAWFSRFLGLPCRLVYLDAQARRRVDPAYAVADDPVSFADGYPVLLTAQASLDALNARLETPLPMNRFRPNLVVAGFDAFAEDGFAQVRLGEVLFHVVKPCARCVVTTIDQQTARPGREPLRTLATFRRRDGKVYFGQNLIPAQPGTVRVGDRAEGVARKELEGALRR